MTFEEGRVIQATLDTEHIERLLAERDEARAQLAQATAERVVLREVVEYVLEVTRRDGVNRPAQEPGERLAAIDEICVATLAHSDVPHESQIKTAVTRIAVLREALTSIHCYECGPEPCSRCSERERIAHANPDPLATLVWQVVEAAMNQADAENIYQMSLKLDEAVLDLRAAAPWIGERTK